ncbi:MAG: HIT domain-containing protein [Roseibium sp.]
MDQKPCVFCEIVAGRLPAWKVYENDRILAFFDQNAIADYHTLIVPKRHVCDIFEIEDRDIKALASAIRSICRTYKDKLGLDALQVISSNGAEAQQDVFHLHFHIVPRKENDGQNIQWTPDESVPARFDKLLERLQRVQQDS